MADQKLQKRNHLREAGLLHPEPERVRDPLFEQTPEFFDREDHLQVRYEMLRAHLVERDAIRAICGRFGVSRQTFYNLQARFVDQGTGGLLPKRPGPKGPRKLTAEVLAFVSQRLANEEVPSTTGLREEIQGRFGVALHRRTLEKLVKDIRAKKNGAV
jgi:transposase